MFLIDEPFVSDFLINTIRDNNFNIVATSQAKQLITDHSLNWISEENAISILEKTPHTPLYTNSENSIAWINKHLPDSQLSNHIEIFKNKVAFRELIRESFPTFFFMSIKLEAIQELDISKIQFPFVIKPSVGFFSLGVHIIHNIEDWHSAKEELNISNLQSTFPKEVLDTSNFIIEEYIEGEEYAIDAYFNKDGEVVILNILHHKFSSRGDTSDRVYSTSREIIYENKNRVERFLQKIGDKLGLRNFPLHVEIRINKDGQISPIEINPLRFGGWCTTADLSGYALGINPYEFFLNAKKPNWEEVFKDKRDKKFSIVVLNNNSGIAPEEIRKFRYDLIEKDFEHILNIRKFDIKKYPVFGFLFTETSMENEKELDGILNSDLRKYIETN